MKKNEIKLSCGACLVGLIFALLEVLIVIGESIGWINFNSGLDSFLFMMFLLFFVSSQDKKHNNRDIKKIYTEKSKNG